MKWSPITATASLVVLITIVGCSRPPGQPTAADVPLEPKQVRDFATLYRLNCAGCHGLEGRGNGALALANPIYLAIADDSVLRRVTAQGIPGTLMPAFAQSAGGMLTDEQIGILVAGIRKRWANPEGLKGGVPPPYAASLPGDPQRGVQVYKSYCVACHGSEGQGTSTVGSIVDGSFLALVSNQNLRTTLIAGRPDLGHPDWNHYEPQRALTDQQLTDVVAWLVSQRVSAPGAPYPKSPPNVTAAK